LSRETLISIVDDDEGFLAAIASLTRSLGFAIEALPTAADFLASSGLRETARLIADLNMPGLTGVELHRRLPGSGYSIPSILITAYPLTGFGRVPWPSSNASATG